MTVTAIDWAELAPGKLVSHIRLLSVQDSTMAHVLDMTERQLEARVKLRRISLEQAAKLRVILVVSNYFQAATGQLDGTDTKPSYDKWLITPHTGTLMLMGAPVDVIRTGQPDNARDILVAFLQREYGDELRYFAP